MEWLQYLNYFKTSDNVYIFSEKELQIINVRNSAPWP